MKKQSKKKWIYICSCLLVATLAATLLVGCTGTTPPPVTTKNKFTVTVENGIGGGEYKKDKECVVSATVADDKAFSRWMSGESEVSRDNPYSFTVKDDITLTAVIGTPYRLMVEGGKIGDTSLIESQVIGGENVSVKAKSTAVKTFLYWVINDGEEKITTNPYSFTINSDVVAKAIFDEICLVSVADGNVYPESKPEEAASSLRFKAGERCTIKADTAPKGQKFNYWYYIDENRKEVKVSDNIEYSFVVAQSRKIYAKYDFYFTLIVENGHIGDDTAITKSDIWANDEVTITALIPENMGFSHWAKGGETVSTTKTHVFKMTSDATFTAVFSDFIILEAPMNDKNQMFMYIGWGATRNTTEFDRQKNADGSRKTAFVDGVDYILYHIYTSQGANKDTDAVGTFKLVKDANGNGKVITMDGTKEIGCGREPGNYYIDNTNNENFYGFFKAAIGEKYSETQDYYFAAQVKGLGNSIYQDSAISQIGTSTIKQK